MRVCSHRRATFYAIQRWKHRPDIVLFNCPDCKGTFALETLLRLWREEGVVLAEVGGAGGGPEEAVLTSAP